MKELMAPLGKGELGMRLQATTTKHYYDGAGMSRRRGWRRGM